MIDLPWTTPDATKKVVPVSSVPEAADASVRRRMWPMELPTAFWRMRGISRSCGGEADGTTADPAGPPREVAGTVMCWVFRRAVACGGLLTATAPFLHIVTLGSPHGPTWSATVSSIDVAPMLPSFGCDIAGAYRATTLATLPAIIAAVALFTRKSRRPRVPTVVRSTPAALTSSGVRVRG